MTSTPPRSRRCSQLMLLLVVVVVAPVVFSAAVATPVHADGELEAEKDADPFVQYIKRYLSKLGYTFGEETSANLLPLSTSTLDDDEEDTDIVPARQENSRHKDDDDFTQIDRILEFLEDRGNEDLTTTSTQKPSSGDKPKQLDPWSLVWYIGSFGGLVAFFLAVSCSECCCHKPAGGQGGPGGVAAGAGLDEPPRLPAVAEGPPPPPYSMFAPPPYDSLCYGVTDQKDKLEVFVVPVPVHASGLTTPPQDGHAHSQPP